MNVRLVREDTAENLEVMYRMVMAESESIESIQQEEDAQVENII